MIQNRSDSDTSPTQGDCPTIEGYRLRETIGRGGMGIVYLADDLALDRPVALKVLPSAFLGDPESIERFRREARALARIHHPNIVPVHAIGETADTLWFAMRFIEGDPLSAVIHAAATGEPTRFGPSLGWSDTRTPRERSPGEPARNRATFTVQIGRQLALALAKVHESGLVHRDVKPSNVLLDANGDPVLVDFGVACDPEAYRLTSDSTSPGTVRFMPPEQLQTAAADPDPRADIYALGVTLYELLTLTPAFGHEELGALVDAVVHGRFERPTRLDNAVPRSLEDVLLCAMARDPENRFQSAREFAEALDDALDSASRTSTRLRPAASAAVSRARAVPKSAWIAVAAVTLGTAAGWAYRGTASDESGRTTTSTASRSSAEPRSPSVEARTEQDHSGVEPSVAEASGEESTKVGSPGDSGSDPRVPVTSEEPSGPPPPIPTGMRNGKRQGPHKDSSRRGLPGPLVGFLESGEESSLMNAAMAFEDGDWESCLAELRETPEPTTMPHKMVYFELLAIVGEPHEIAIARQQAEPRTRGKNRKKPWLPKLPKGVFSKLGRRNK